MPFNIWIAVAAVGVLLSSYIGVATHYYNAGWWAREHEMQAALAEINSEIRANSAAADAEAAAAQRAREAAAREALESIPDEPPIPASAAPEATPGWAPVAVQGPPRSACPCSAIPASVLAKLNRIR